MVMSQVSYAIGVAHPLSISVFTYGSSQKSEQELLHIVNKNFDLRPGVIVRWVIQTFYDGCVYYIPVHIVGQSCFVICYK